MAGDNFECVEESFTDTPWKHQVQDFMHLTGERRSDRGGEHRQTLEDGCFEGCSFFAGLSVCDASMVHTLSA